MLNNNILKDKKVEIGGYILPADFKYLDKDFLLSLVDEEFSNKVKKVYFKLTNKEYNFDKTIDIFMVDDTICTVDLACNKNLNYSDIIFDNENFFTEVCSVISVLVACYLDLIESDIILPLEKVNFALPSNEGLFLLALYIAKKIGLPIDMSLVGGEFKNKPIIKGVYFANLTESDVEDVLGVFFDEYDIALDPISIKGIVALDSYYDNYEDENVSINLNLSNPYLFARRVLNIVSYQKEINVEKAIDKLYLETSQEIPESIINKEIPLYYVENIKLPFDIAISFINTLSKV